VPLRAVALQFPLAHPLVVSVVAGAVSAAQVEDNIRMLGVEIPPQLWSELKGSGLLDSRAPVPGGRE
jgi:D-threo-aldose 1-dehydrogenase